jgi:hypothetical protein
MAGAVGFEPTVLVLETSRLAINGRPLKKTLSVYQKTANATLFFFFFVFCMLFASLTKLIHFHSLFLSLNIFSSCIIFFFANRASQSSNFPHKSHFSLPGYLKNKTRKFPPPIFYVFGTITRNLHWLLIFSQTKGYFTYIIICCQAVI